MKITLLAMGSKMPPWVSAGCTAYMQRLPPECSLRLLEIPLAKRTKSADRSRLMQQEGARMLKAIPAGDRVIALTEQGTLWNTLDFAKHLRSWYESGSNLSLLIGGPEGLSPLCLTKANQHWSLSPLTWPHSLVRIMVAEQIYRAWSVLSSHPYHRS